MYRVSILPNVHVLYATSLSYASHEFEIIHAGYAEFTNKGNFEVSYNNKNNEWGILSNDTDKFNSVDIILNGYNDKLNPYNNLEELNRSINIYRTDRNRQKSSKKNYLDK
jgi:hypothetical protein